MKLPELKKRVRSVWESLNTWKDGVVVQPENFDKEVKSFGDRRYKKTWIKALCRFEAMLSYKSCLDSWALITISFNFTPDRWDYEYRHQILDEFLMYPDGLEIIRDGLEQIFSASESDFSPQEREDAHGFFRLLEERGGESGRVGLPDGFTRALAGAGTAA
jgi:hypothetical protein